MRLLDESASRKNEMKQPEELSASSLAMLHSESLVPIKSGSPENQAALQPDKSLAKAHRDSAVREAFVDCGSSLAANMLGLAAMAWAVRTGQGKLACIVAGIGAAGIGKAAGKSAVEGFSLPRTAADFGWGCLDGAAGIGGAAVEKLAGRCIAEAIARRHLGGDLARELLIAQGQQHIENQVIAKIAANAVRGAAGGATGMCISSFSQRAIDNWQSLKYGNSWQAAAGIGGGVLRDTAAGVFTGGLIGAGAAAFLNRGELAGRLAAMLPAGSSSKLTVLHFNDLHSCLRGEHGLTRLATRLKQVQYTTRGAGGTAFTFNLGDEYSGNLVSQFTRQGALENQAIAALKPTVIVPGNHAVDGGTIGDWLKITLDNKIDGGYRTLAANVEFTDPATAQLAMQAISPFKIQYVRGTGGTSTRVGIIGLTTHELGAAGITISDHVEAARRCVDQLHCQGIDKIIVASHLGTDKDTRLARSVKGISAIIGGHSHDAMTTPRWVSNGSDVVPIFQAGSESRYLGELGLTWDDKGKLDRYRTTANVHQIDSKIPEDPQITKLLERPFVSGEKLQAAIEPRYRHLVPPPADSSSMLYSISEAVSIIKKQPGYALPIGDGQEIYPRSLEKLDNAFVRRQQTPLGTLVSDALLAGMNADRAARGLPPLNGMLKHSGGIRNCLPAGKDMSLDTLANIYCNGQNWKELTTATMNGRTLKKVLEFGVSDLKDTNAGNKRKPAAEAIETAITERRDDHKPLAATIVQQIQPALKPLVELAGDMHELLKHEPPLSVPDLSGNLLQVSGIKYAVNLSKPAGARISDIRVFDLDEKRYLPLADETQYTFGTRLHPIDKWAKNNVFDSEPRFAAIMTKLESESTDPHSADSRKRNLMVAARLFLQAPENLNLSQPQLTADYLNGKTRLPNELFTRAPRRDRFGGQLLMASNFDPPGSRIRFISQQPDPRWSAIAALHDSLRRPLFSVYPQLDSGKQQK